MGIINDRLALLITADAAQAVREIEKVGRTAERDLGKATTGAEKFASTALKTGAAMVGFSAIVGGALFKAAQAASEAQVSDAKLNNTLANSGVLAGANRQPFVDLAKSIQGYSVVTDEAVKGTEATLGQFGLTEKQILALTPLVVDLSRKMGIDLDAASKAVGKAVEGNAGGLQRLGVIVQKNAQGTTDFNGVLNTLKGTVGGFAAAEGKTFEGQLTRIKNQLHDVEEGVGVGVIQALGNVVGPVSRASVAFNQLDDGTKATVGRVATIGTATVGAVGALGLLAGTVSKLRETFRGTDGELNNFGRAASTIGTVGTVAGTVIVLAESLNTLDSKINQLQHGEANLPKIAGDLADFGKGSAAAGELTKQFGANVDDLASKLETIKHYGPKGPSILPFVIGDAITGYTDAKKDVDALDKSLAALVSSGRPDLAAAAHDRLADAVRKGGGSVKDFDHELNDYHKALDQAAFGTKTAGDATKDFAADVDALNVSAKKTADTLTGGISAIQAYEQADQQVTETQKALTEAQDGYAKKARDVADANNAIQKATLDVKDAEKAVADARRNAPRELAKAKEDEAAGIHSIADATDDLAVATAKYGGESRQAADAADKVAAAKSSHADAVDKLNDLQSDPNRGVEEAEQRLTDAKQAQVDAQQKLNEAKKEDPAADIANAEQAARDAVVNRELSYEKMVAVSAALNTALGTTVDLTDTSASNLASIVNAILLALQTAASPEGFGKYVPGVGEPGTYGGPRAAGGPVSAGDYLIGEKGPEMLHLGPTSSGVITSNADLMGGHTTVIQVTVPPGTDSSLAQRTADAVAWAQRTRGLN